MILVDYNDPCIPKTRKQHQHDLRMTSKKLSAKMLTGYDVVLISTDHSDYVITGLLKKPNLWLILETLPQQCVKVVAKL